MVGEDTIGALAELLRYAVPELFSCSLSVLILQALCHSQSGLFLATPAVNALWELL